MLTFIDLFAGIGGFHLAFHRQGCFCVFASEIDKHARKTYQHNFEKISPNLFVENKFNNDILDIKPTKIPDFDILCAGFPCQPFSQAGQKKGFEDERGNMFFVLRDIIQAKRPQAFFLENVRHLEKHDEGKTFATIKHILETELNYILYYKIVKASDYGLPQHRPRLFMVGFRKEDTYPVAFKFPQRKSLSFTRSNVLGGKCDKEIGFTLRVGGRGSKINDRCNWEFYNVENEIKRITVENGKKMMGFPNDFSFPVSEIQAIKQLGNSVAVLAIEEVAKSIIAYLKTKNKKTCLPVDLKKGQFVLEGAL